MVASYQSPGVYSNEIDTTTGVTAVSTSTGAFVGNFAWGPVLERTEITSGQQLATVFGEPTTNTATSFFTAWNFLQYAGDIQIVRTLNSGAKNATANGTGVLIPNDVSYFQNNYPAIVTNSFVARYPGGLGNSLGVYVFANSAAWTANASNTADPLYSFARQFPYAPNTSPYVNTASGGTVTGDALHLLVVDSLGHITGAVNTVLEVWPNLSRLKDSFGPTGLSNYYREFIFQNSLWINVTGIPSSNTFGWDTTIALAPTGGNFGNDSSANVALLSGANNGVWSAANTTQGIDLFDDPAIADVDLFMVGDPGTDSTIINYAVAMATQRKDLVVFGSPLFANTVAPTGPAQDIVNFGSSLTHSSYLVMDTMWKFQYDQYNNVYRYIPGNGDIAGLCAQTDQTNAPWWSPAGFKRGNILNLVKLSYNPGKLVDRNLLYSNSWNPVTTFQGQGTVLYGDKTFLSFPSVFDHINVRRLFIYLEKIISKAAQADLFEFNDVFTQTAFVNMVSPVLRSVQSQRGISSFQVVCDSTNNTPDVINANQFVGTIFIVPNQSINFIQLNFVAVDNGVSFSTVVGQVGV